jgi:DNA-binding transcriptional ArsR family regulator
VGVGQLERTLPQSTADSIDLGSVLAALADPVRRAMARAIRSETEMIDCRTIAANLDLSPATTSHHWRVLREAGVTTIVAQGRHRFVRLRRNDMDQRFPGLLTAILDAPSSEDPMTTGPAVQPTSEPTAAASLPTPRR